METLFISDLHLSRERPEQLILFTRLLRGPARDVDAVYILGDLFEYFWTGIDDKTPPNPEIINELLDFTRSGRKLFFLRGNRELMLDRSFEALTGCILLPDQTVINLHGTDVLVMHGDLLCSRDRKYQMFRRFMEIPAIKRVFLMLPGRLRIFLARVLQPAIRRSMQQKPEEIMDADPDTVIKTMHNFHVSELIHGHTHRPGIHYFELDGTKARRIVLGDWYDEAMILICTDERRRLVPVNDYLGKR